MSPVATSKFVLFSEFIRDFLVSLWVVMIGGGCGGGFIMMFNPYCFIAKVHTTVDATSRFRMSDCPLSPSLSLSWNTFQILIPNSSFGHPNRVF